jgi:hypothetical protein
MSRWYAIYSNILYLHFSKGFINLPESAKSAVSPKKPIMRLFKMVGYSLVRLIGNLFKSVEQPGDLTGKVWLYVVSQNNYDSLHFLKEGLPDSVLVAGQSKSLGKYKSVVKRISLRKKILYYYKFLPLYFEFLEHQKQSTLRFADLLFDAVGFHEVYLQKIKKYKPKAIVFANDHNADARAMLLAAKKLGVKTIYLQHASVNPMFPPLSFDLNLLEGQDALDKYKACGPIAGETELVGMPKADPYLDLRINSKKIKSIGIGCNLMDETTEIEELVSLLFHSIPNINIIVRPHPRDKRNFNNIVNLSPRISISNSVEESTFEYLRTVEVQISGNSGIHLEAVLLNVWSIYMNMNSKEKLHDYFGFVKHELVDAPLDKYELINMINERLNSKPDVYLRAQYYNATVGTEYDGKSAKLALKAIKDFIDHPGK